MSNLTVFYIDDDEENHYLVNSAIRAIDKEVKLQSFYTGNELLNLFGQSKELLPDLIILDINIPGESGIGCLKILKKDPVLAVIPVVMYSSANLQAEIDEVLSSGAIAYFVKADTFDAIKDQWREILGSVSGS